MAVRLFERDPEEIAFSDGDLGFAGTSARRRCRPCVAFWGLTLQIDLGLVCPLPTYSIPALAVSAPAWRHGLDSRLSNDRQYLYTVHTRVYIMVLHHCSRISRAFQRYCARCFSAFSDFVLFSVILCVLFILSRRRLQRLCDGIQLKANKTTRLTQLDYASLGYRCFYAILLYLYYT